MSDTPIYDELAAESEDPGEAETYTLDDPPPVLNDDADDPLDDVEEGEDDGEDLDDDGDDDPDPVP